MIKILYTIPNFDTAGSGKALLNIAAGLDKSRFEPHIMCKHDRGAFFKTVEKSGIPVHLCNYETPMRPVISGLRGCWKVSRVLREIKPDIIHSFHYAADYSEALAARMAGCRWVFTKKNMNWGGSSKNGWLLRSKLANGIIIQNTDMSTQLYPGSKKTHLIPRGVNTNNYRINQFANDNVSSEVKYIICVANLVPLKGVEVLIEAFKEIRQKSFSDNWKVKIVGDDTNEYGASLKKKYQDLIKEQCLIFTGKVGDVKSELQSSSIFVLPTLTGEGSPVSLLEAMSMGLPVIGSRIPGIVDQLTPLGEDHLFEPGRSEDLSGKLKKFMDLSCAQKRELNENISRYCRENWDISIEIERHERFYLKTLGL